MSKLPTSLFTKKKKRIVDIKKKKTGGKEMFFIPEKNGVHVFMRDS